MKKIFLLLFVFATTFFCSFAQDIKSYATLSGGYLSVKNCEGVAVRMEYGKGIKFVGVGLSLGYNTTLPYTNHFGFLVNRGQYFQPGDTIDGMTEAFLGLHLTADIVRLFAKRDTPHSLKAGIIGGITNPSEIRKTEDQVRYFTRYISYFTFTASYEFNIYKSYGIGCFYERNLNHNDANVYGIMIKHSF